MMEDQQRVIIDAIKGDEDQFMKQSNIPWALVFFLFFFSPEVQ
jgi:hypothetical protein